MNQLAALGEQAVKTLVQCGFSKQPDQDGVNHQKWIYRDTPTIGISPRALLGVNTGDNVWQRTFALCMPAGFCSQGIKSIRVNVTADVKCHSEYFGLWIPQSACTSMTKVLPEFYLSMSFLYFI